MTNQERIIQAIKEMSQGTPMKVAAEHVGWSYQTLKNRLRDEYQRQGVQNALHLASLYFRQGTIT